MSDASLALEKLLAVMTALRDPQHGCPWDLEQDYSSIAKHTLEEVYEVIEAIEQADAKALKSELGDLLFQVVFYAQLGSENGDFDFAGIADAISAKLLHRHPHVFPQGTLESAGQPPDTSSDQVVVAWEKIKKAERAAGEQYSDSAMDDVPLALPAIMRAHKLQKRAANEGFDWSGYAGVMEKLREEMAELEEAAEKKDAKSVEEELGDLFFTMVNLSRHLELDAETSLRKANRKFEARFRAMEKMAAADGSHLNELPESALEEYWQRVKHGEPDSSEEGDA